MKKHTCIADTLCCCYSLALEPNENCPVHGCQYPVKCGICGKFMKSKSMYYRKNRNNKVTKKLNK